MVNKNSIYTLNKKNPDAIVYPSAIGKPIVITRDDFPSEEEFLAFKKWSDENFHEEEKLDHREANHIISADTLSEAALSVPATDVIMERQHERTEKRRMASDMVSANLLLSTLLITTFATRRFPSMSSVAASASTILQREVYSSSETNAPVFIQ